MKERLSYGDGNLSSSTASCFFQLSVKKRLFWSVSPKRSSDGDRVRSGDGVPRSDDGDLVRSGDGVPRLNKNGMNGMSRSDIVYDTVGKWHFKNVERNTYNVFLCPRNTDFNLFNGLNSFNRFREK